MSKNLAKGFRGLKIFFTILVSIAFLGFVVIWTNTTKVEPLDTMKIAPGLYAVKGGIVNMFIITDGKNTIAIDTGDKVELIAAGMQKIKVDPKTGNTIFLTHSDYDHTTGIGFFPNARIYISKAEEDMMNGKIARFFGVVHNQKLPRPYKLLPDKAEIYVGSIKVKVFDTPGHTYGSMSYLVNDSYLFTGDTIALLHGKAKPFRMFNYSNSLEYQSIMKLAGLKDITVLCTAHNGYSSDFKTVFQEWILR